MTGSGPDGQITPVDTLKKLIAKGPDKSKSKAKAKKNAKHKPGAVPKDIELSDRLINARVTPKTLASAAYQKKLKAFYIKIHGPALMNSLNRSLHADSPKAQQLTAEIFDFVPPRSGISINQNNQTAHIRMADSGDGGRMGSFEDIARILQEKRQQRALGPATIEPVFEATPDE